MKLLPLTTAVGGSGRSSSACIALAGLVALRAALGDQRRVERAARLLERQPVAAHALVGGAQPGDADRHRDPRVARARSGARRAARSAARCRSRPGRAATSTKRSSSTTGTPWASRYGSACSSAPTDGASSIPSTWRSASARTIRSSCSGSSRVSPSSSVWPARPAACLDRGDDVHEVRVREPADGQPERLRAAAGQRAGDRVRPVARALDRRQHAAASCARWPGACR